MTIQATDLLDLLESIEELDEVAPKKIVKFTGGKRVTALDCPPGYKLDGTTCKKMAAAEVRAKHVGAMKAAKKRKHDPDASRKRMNSLKKRASAGM